MNYFAMYMGIGFMATLYGIGVARTLYHVKNRNRVLNDRDAFAWFIAACLFGWPITVVYHTCVILASGAQWVLKIK